MSDKKSKKEAFDALAKEWMEFGFTYEQICEAWAESNQNQEKYINNLFLIREKDEKARARPEPDKSYEVFSVNPYVIFPKRSQVSQRSTDNQAAHNYSNSEISGPKEYAKPYLVEKGDQASFKQSPELPQRSNYNQAADQYSNNRIPEPKEYAKPHLIEQDSQVSSNQSLETISRLGEFLSPILHFMFHFKEFHQVIVGIEFQNGQRGNEGRNLTYANLVKSLKNFFNKKLNKEDKELDATLVVQSFLETRDALGNGKLRNNTNMKEVLDEFLDYVAEGISLVDKEKAKFISRFFKGKAKKRTSCFIDGAEYSQKENIRIGPIESKDIEEDFSNNLITFFDLGRGKMLHPSGELVEGNIKIWISELPQVLTFMTPKGSLRIQKEIFLDAYLKENKNKVSKHMENQKKIYEENKIKREKQLQGYLCYGKTGAKVPDILKDVADYMEHYMTKDDLINRELLVCINTLKQLEEKATIKMKTLDINGKDLQYEGIETRTLPLESLKTKYILIGFVVCEENQGNKEYFSFMYNQRKGNWTEFRDNNEIHATNYEVLRFIEGNTANTGRKGERPSSVKCVFYARDGFKLLFDELVKTDKFLEDLAEDNPSMERAKNVAFNKNLKDLFISDINQEKENRSPNRDNKLFYEIAKGENDNLRIIREAYDTYTKNFKDLERKFVGLKKKLVASDSSELTYFPDFVEFLMFDNDAYHIARLIFFKSVLARHGVDWETLGEKRRDLYFKELQNIAEKETLLFPSKDLEVEASSKEILEKKEQEYSLLGELINMVETIFKFIENDKWKKAMLMIGLLHQKCFVFRKTDVYKDHFIAFISYLLKVLLFKCCGLIDQHLMSSKAEKALKTLKIMEYCIYSSRNYLGGEYLKQLALNIKFSQCFFGRSLFSEEQKVFDDFLLMLKNKQIKQPPQDIITAVSKLGFFITGKKSLNLNEVQTKAKSIKEKILPWVKLLKINGKEEPINFIDLAQKNQQTRETLNKGLEAFISSELFCT